MVGWLIVIIQIIAICLRLGGAISWSWWYIMAPLEVVAFFLAINLIWSAVEWLSMSPLQRSLHNMQKALERNRR